jgi:hypothetical protein
MTMERTLIKVAGMLRDRAVQLRQNGLCDAAVQSTCLAINDQAQALSMFADETCDAEEACLGAAASLVALGRTQDALIRLDDMCEWLKTQDLEAGPALCARRQEFTRRMQAA